MVNQWQAPVAGNTILTSDLKQLLYGLSGKWDVGSISVFQPIANPAAASLAAGSAGNPNGTYRCIVVYVTGWQRDDGGIVVVGFAPSAEATITVTNAQIDWTLPTPPSGVVARILYRTVAGGASGSEKFAVWIGDSTTLTYADNVADASLGTGMPTSSSTPAVYGVAIPAAVPTSNTTGSSIAVYGGSTAPPNPVPNALWINTSGASALLEYYNGTSWQGLGAINATTTTPGVVEVSQNPASGAPVTAIILANPSEIELTTTSATNIFSVTPTASGKFRVNLYVRVVTATTTVTATLTYTSSSGSQTYTIWNAQSLAVGDHAAIPFCFQATAASITLSVTAGTANQVYVDALLEGLG